MEHQWLVSSCGWLRKVNPLLWSSTVNSGQTFWHTRSLKGSRNLPTTVSRSPQSTKLGLVPSLLLWQALPQLSPQRPRISTSQVRIWAVFIWLGLRLSMMVDHLFQVTTYTNRRQASRQLGPKQVYFHLPSLSIKSHLWLLTLSTASKLQPLISKGRVSNPASSTNTLLLCLLNFKPQQWLVELGRLPESVSRCLHQAPAPLMFLVINFTSTMPTATQYLTIWFTTVRQYQVYNKHQSAIWWATKAIGSRTKF